MTNGRSSDNSDDFSTVRFIDDDTAAMLRDHLASIRKADSDNWTTIKQNPRRTVYRGRIGNRHVFLKHYHGKSLSHKLKKMLGISTARREYQFAEYLNRNDIRAPRPLAGEFCGDHHWFLSMAVEPSVPADIWHLDKLKEGPAGSGLIRSCTTSLARLIGKLHAAGIIHGDLHCGNILVRTDSKKPSVVFTDLHRLKKKQFVSRRAMAANLAQLFHDRMDFTTRSDRLRFLRAYLSESGAKGSLRGWAYMVELFARRHSASQYRKRDRRITGNNRYFAKLKLPGGWKANVMLRLKRSFRDFALADVVFTPEQWKELLADPQTLLEDNHTEVIKDSRSGKVVRRNITIGNRTLDVYIKQPRTKSLRKLFFSAFKRSRCSNAFILGHRLLTRRILTATPLAALEKRSGPFLKQSILITEAVDHLHLNTFLIKWLGDTPDEKHPITDVERKELYRNTLWQLGKMLRRLHDNNFFHRDLKANNIRIQREDGNNSRIFLVDLEGVSSVQFMTMKRRFRNLMRLNVSLLLCPPVNNSGRLRMLLGYLRRPGAGRIHFKPIWRLLEKWSEAKLRKIIRSRRRRQREVRRPG